MTHATNTHTHTCTHKLHTQGIGQTVLTLRGMITKSPGGPTGPGGPSAPGSPYKWRNKYNKSTGITEPAKQVSTTKAKFSRVGIHITKL